MYIGTCMSLCTLGVILKYNLLRCMLSARKLMITSPNSLMIALTLPMSVSRREQGGRVDCSVEGVE